MPISAKEEPPAALQPGAELFARLGDLYTKPTVGEAGTSARLKRSVAQLDKRLTAAQLKCLRDTVQALASHLDRLLPIETDRELEEHRKRQIDRARREDAIGATVLAEARRARKTGLSTKESIRDGNDLVARARKAAMNAMPARAMSGEFLTSGQLQDALQVGRQAISLAVKSGRMFVLIGPSGENYYPAYFADPRYDRRELERISKTLGGLPGASKHYFFTTSSTFLKGASPLEALRNGRLREVLTAAAGFVER